MALISLENYEVSLDDCDDDRLCGIISIWWWKDGNDPTELWVSNYDVWHILTAKQVYELMIDREIIIDDETVIEYFTKLD